jgi:glutaminase
LVNAGAIATVSLVQASDREDRWARILDMQSRFAGTLIALSAEINESEQTSNLHNRAIACLLASGGSCFCEPLEALDVYTRQCSTLVTCAKLAAMAATLANRGVNPQTRISVVKRQNVSRVLAEMVMQGLYDTSGDWAFEVGIPAKSGVGGGIMAVVPGRLGIAAFAPPLDEYGNSVRGQIAVANLAKRLNLNLYDG